MVVVGKRGWKKKTGPQKKPLEKKTPPTNLGESLNPNLFTFICTSKPSEKG